MGDVAVVIGLHVISDARRLAPERLCRFVLEVHLVLSLYVWLCVESDEVVLSTTLQGTDHTFSDSREYCSGFDNVIASTRR